ncbi:MAG TPA: HDOD domain-containing protein [Acidobacteriaceae bacterium]|nr:HDOD domain-containing protein [Acidobacteriaceae bacterium]
MVLDPACSVAGHFADVPPAIQPGRHLARQPILDVRRDVVGYELLFREGWENHFTGERDTAIRKTLDNCVSIDIESLAGGGLAFVNCSRDALLGRLMMLLPAATTVLEVLETVEPDDEVVRVCTELRGLGYRIALDDFVPRSEMRRLVEIADYIKVDFRASDAEARREIRAMVRTSNATLLAEKVEDQEEFDMAQGEGFELFQGYFFCRPKIIAGREIPPHQMNYMRLLAALARMPLDVDEVIDIIRLEPPLSYRVLRLANSPMWGVQKTVTSIHEALMLVGEDRFRMLVSVVGTNMLGHQQPAALIALSLERARFCEQVAPLIGENPTEQFILGLLSLLDAMTETPMEAIARSLPLRTQAKDALMGVENHVSMALRTIQSFESGAARGRVLDCETLGVDEEALTRIYVESVKWAANSISMCR